MFKKILISIFATLIIGAASVSAYNNAVAPTPVLAQSAEVEVQSTRQDSFTVEQSQSQGQSYGQISEQGIVPDDEQAQQGQSQGQGGGNGYQGGRNEIADSTRGGQSVGMEVITLHGTVIGSELASLTLTTDAGDILTVPLDSLALGITLLPGEGVTLGGYWNLDGIFTAGQITLDATGDTYAISDNGGNGGNSGNNGSGYRGGGNGGGGKGK